MKTHHLTAAVVLSHHLQCLHDDESCYDRISGGDGRDDVASHGCTNKQTNIANIANTHTNKDYGNYSNH